MFDRLLSLLVPSRSLSWDTLRPLTADKALSQLWAEHVDAVLLAAAGPTPPSMLRPSWHSAHPEPWDDGTTPATTVTEPRTNGCSIDPVRLALGWAIQGDANDDGTTPRCLP